MYRDIRFYSSRWMENNSVRLPSKRLTYYATNSDNRSHRSFPARQSSTGAHSMGAHESASSQDGRIREDSSTRPPSRLRSYGSFGAASEDHTTVSGMQSDRQRTDNAIAIQSELQRAFIGLSKDLHPMILGIMRSETPSWLKKCCQENYFSSYAYRNAKIRQSILYPFRSKFPRELPLTLYTVHLQPSPRNSLSKTCSYLRVRRMRVVLATWHLQNLFRSMERSPIRPGLESSAHRTRRVVPWGVVRLFPGVQKRLAR